MKVISIYVAKAKGEPMKAVPEAHATVAAGLDGDRYGPGKGTWSSPRNKLRRQVSLIDAAAIENANAHGFSTTVEPWETRRNIVTEGVDVDTLIGKRFRIGEAIFEGTGLCPPCERPPLLAGRPPEERMLFPIAFEDHGGLLARVIESGLIRPGDAITIAGNAPTPRIAATAPPPRRSR